MSKNVKKILSYAAVAVFFLVLAYAFVPQVLSGKIVNQSDASGYSGIAHEMNEWNREHPQDITSWTNSLFGGMPTTTFATLEQGDWTQGIYHFLLTGRRPATYLFISLLGAFLLMLSLGIDGLVAVGGAVAVTFCSYNIQIIQVGHNTKMQAIAFLPWALAAFVFTYRSALDDRKKWWLKSALGSALFAFAVSFQVKANHQQITYYLALMLIVYALALFVWLVSSRERRSKLGRFFAASALLLVLGCAGIATNANKLIPIFEYTPHSMRGGSELASASNSGSRGLALDYATAWSYGWEELPNLLIPNFNGGSSYQPMNPDRSMTYQVLKDAGVSSARDMVKALPLYWGPQPFTAGPMYMGAITVFLFILGLFLYDGKDKWWVIVCTLLAIFLAVGSHFMWFTRLFYDHMPFYNKFRTVSMALVVLQVTLPVLGFLLLDRIVRGGVSREDFLRKGGIAGGAVALFCLAFALVPTLAGSLISPFDGSQPEQLVPAMMVDRSTILRQDAFRSLILVVAAFALIFWGLTVPKGAQETFSQDPGASFARRRTAVALVCFLVLVDLFCTGKRYLSSDDFISPRAFNSQFNQRPVDEYILEDEDLSYRVLDLSTDTFNDSHASYWHKSIGGYSPAKLQRYQELADKYFQSEINSIYDAAESATTIDELEANMPSMPVLSALNMRYVVFGAEVAPLENSNALGNAWFVGDALQASSPDEALALLDSVDMRSVAVLEPADAEAYAASGLSLLRISDPELAPVIFNAPFIPYEENGEYIEMTHYAPNELRYHYVAAEPRLAVFSEVYYPEGWHAWLADVPEALPDVNASAAQKARAAGHGTDVPVLRADWLLRAAVLPAGEHDLIMRFDPESVTKGAAVSRASSISIIVLLLLAIAGMIVSGRRSETTTENE